MPRSSLPCCGTPRTPLRLPCSPAEVSLSPGFQDSLPALPHAGDAAHIFPSSVTIPRSTCLKALPPALKQANISPRSSPPHHLYKCSRCFVSLKVFSPADCHNHKQKITVKIGKIPPYCYSVFKVRTGLLLPACQNTSYYFLRCLLTDPQQPVYILWHYLFSNS